MAAPKRTRKPAQAPAEPPVHDLPEEVPVETPAVKEAIAEAPAVKGEEEKAPVETPAEAPVETPAETPAVKEEPVGEEPSMRDRLVALLGPSMDDSEVPPTLIQFKPRNGRPASVLIDADAGAVEKAWAMWSEECGSSTQEAFIMALLDASDAWPAHIMRPCMFLELK